MASRFRSLAASSVMLVLAFVISPAPSTFAHTGNAELPVTLVINDICTLDTGVQRASVACSAGGQYRIVSGAYFARVRGAAKVRGVQAQDGEIVEIAF
jgi:hypothetical protein